MTITPKVKAFLSKLGINTTQLQWRLYRWEQRWEKRGELLRLPASLQWLRYPHKVCWHCGAMADRDARRCDSCGRRLPPMLGYRVARLFGLAAPEGAATAVNVFLMVILAISSTSITQTEKNSATNYINRNSL